MTHHTRFSNLRNLRTFLASLLSYVLLTSQLAPVAMAFNGSADRRAPGGTPDIERKTTSEAPPQGRVAGSFAPVPVPLRVTPAGIVPIITASKVDSFPDPDGDGKVSPGQTITYSVTITNTGPDPAFNVTLNDTVDPNTTIVGGSAVSTPIAFDDAYNVVGNVRIQPNAAQGLLANDINPNTGNNSGLTASGPATSTQGGQVTINSDGSFSYNPPAGFTGTDTFTYTVTSANGTDTGSVTLTVGTAGAVIWFINASAPVGGDGRLTNPFNCYTGTSSGAQTCFSDTAADDPGDNIFLFSGSYTGGNTLLNNQKLIGQGASASLATITGVTVEAYSDPLPPTGGASPTITTTVAATNAVPLGQGNTLRGFTVGNTTGAKIFGNNFGTLTVGNNASPDVILNGTGQALNLTNGTFAATSAFSSVATTSSGTQGINLSSVAGTVSLGSTTVSGSTTQGILVGTTTANINFGNTSVSGGTDGISLQNNSAGTRTFGTLSVSNNSGVGFLHAVGGGTTTVSGATTITNPGGIGISINSSTTAVTFSNTNVTQSGGTGVFMSGNTGAVTFADFDISPDNGQRALHAVQNTGTITTTSGTITTTNPSASSNAIAIEIVGVSAASRTPVNLTFNSVSANNAINGIVLTNTSDGGNAFRILGTGSTDGSGGTISNITNRGASFVNADDISLSNMTFTNVGTVNGADPTNSGSTCGDPNLGGNAGCNAGIHLQAVTGATLTNVDMNGGVQVGINGNNVTNFVLSNSNVLNFGDQVREDGLKFLNMLGTSSISGSTISGNEAVQVHVENNTGTLGSLTVQTSTISTSAAPNGSHGLLFVNHGTANSKLIVQNMTFSNLFSNCIHADTDSSGTMELTETASTFNGCGASGITLAQDGSGLYKFNIHDNGSLATPTFLGGTSSHAINVNQAGNAPVSAVMQGAITNNFIGNNSSSTSSTVGGSAINVLSVAPGTLTVLISGNTTQGTGANGINVQMSEDTNVNHRVNATILNNNATVSDVNSFDGIRVVAGALSSPAPGDSGILCAEINNNDASATAAGNDFTVRQRFNTTFQLRGYTGGSTDTAAVQTHLDVNQANDPLGAGNDWFITTQAPGGGFVNTPGGAQCTQPVLPTMPETFQGDTIAPGGQPNDMGSPGAPVEQITASSNTVSITARPFISSPQPQTVAATTKPAAQATVASAVVVDPGVRYRPKPKPVAPPAGDGLPTPPVIVGDNLTWNVGTLPAGASVTLTFQVVVDDPVAPGVTQVSNQGTVTADGGISVLTDDPSEPGANDPTVTLIAVPPDLFVRDARVAEPTSGSTSMIFILALSTPAPASGITVNLSTADVTATGGDCPSGNDYTTVSGANVTFASGEQIKTFPITVCSDANAEGDETFSLNVNSAPGAVIADGTGVGTITAANEPGTILISELRTSGPNGAGDDFVEIYNNTDTPHTVPAGGYGLFKRGVDCNALPELIGTISATTVIPARGHYLFVGSTYSLGSYAAGDVTLTADIESDFNVGLFSTVDPLAISTANRLDAVGFGVSTGGVCDLLLEGTTLSPASGSTSEYSFVREFTLVSNNVPTPRDGNDNTADFTVVSTTPATPVGSNAAPRLGVPGPENLAGPNLKKFTQVGAQLIDPMLPQSSPPNRARDTTPDPANNSTFGTLASRRKFINNTGGDITRLRFRIYDITTSPSPPGTADLRARTSGTTTVTVTGVGSVTVLGTTLETPPAQPNSGGLNSSLAAGTVMLGTPLANGASINLQFLFGVQQTGSFRVFVFVEAAP